MDEDPEKSTFRKRTQSKSARVSLPFKMEETFVVSMFIVFRKCALWQQKGDWLPCQRLWTQIQSTNLTQKTATKSSKKHSNLRIWRHVVLERKNGLLIHTDQGKQEEEEDLNAKRNLKGKAKAENDDATESDSSSEDDQDLLASNMDAEVCAVRLR